MKNKKLKMQNLKWLSQSIFVFEKLSFSENNYFPLNKRYLHSQPYVNLNAHPMKDFSYITGSDPAFIENLYKDFTKDPNSVDPEFKKFFEGFDFAVSNGAYV